MFRLRGIVAVIRQFERRIQYFYLSGAALALNVNGGLVRYPSQLFTRLVATMRIPRIFFDDDHSEPANWHQARHHLGADPRARRRDDPPPDERRRRGPEFGDSASRQQAIALNAAEAKSSVRGMQIGIRDILMSSSPTEMQKAASYFNERQTSALKFSGEMARLSQSPENRKRIDRLTVLIGNFQKGEQQIEAIRKQELALESKKDGE